jgi:hypothetical protein
MFGGYRHKAKLNKLIDQWTEYRRMVLARLGVENLKPSEERKFLNLKGKIAESLAWLPSHLGFEDAQEAQNYVRAISSLLNRYPSLYAQAPVVGEHRAEFEREWHSHFLFLNRLKGIEAVGEAEAASNGSPTQEIPRRSPARQAAVLLLRLLVLVGVVGLVLRFVPWERLGVESPESKAQLDEVSGFVTGVWDSLSTKTDGFNVAGVLDPVSHRFGAEVATVLVAMLLITVGYWIFIRIK